MNATSAWYHSCIYDKDVLDRDLVWCATEVDAEGVMVPGKSGICDDERRTAVSGPGKIACSNSRLMNAGRYEVNKHGLNTYYICKLP